MEQIGERTRDYDRDRRERDRDDSYRRDNRDRARDGERHDDEHREKRRRTSRSPRRKQRDRSPDSERDVRRDRSPRRERSPRRDRSRDRSRERTYKDRDTGRRRSTRGDRSPRDRRDRDRSPRDRRNRDRDSDRHRSHRSRRSPRRHSRDRSDRRGSNTEPTSALVTSRKAGVPLPDQAAAFRSLTSGGSRDGSAPPIEKQQPNFNNTGVLAKLTNTVETGNGEKIELKYQEPPESRKPPPSDQWKIFVFKGDAMLETLELWARSCWLVGREEKVVDVLALHPSISKQHAVIQFRAVEKKNEFGDRITKVKPYVIDLGSKHGTFLNGELIESERFVELRDKDLLRFGTSEREYVVMLPPKELL